MTFSYKSSETLQKGGKKIIRNVTIKNKKGTKSVTIYHKGKKRGSVKKHISPDHLVMIKNRKFVPGLFADCVCTSKS
jgi:hypothetical protein